MGDRMKLPIKKKYFNAIKNGNKILEYRDAHITFICEETGERLKCNIIHAAVIDRPPKLYPEVLKDDKIIRFTLEGL